ncbi:MAG: tryptophanase [Saprospiraceae bacterium]|nr:tryptophanase [Saprospiraceae bacterium]
MSRTLVEPFRIKMVEPVRVTTEAYREEALRNTGFNPFLLNSDDVFIDLLTDSGTGAMSQAQWAGMIMGDESYAGARSWLDLEKEVKDLSGMEYVLPTHQGRASERILFGILGGKGKYFLSNTHFDTTRANIENTGATAIDLMPEESMEPDTYLPFKGNIDLKSLVSSINSLGKENIAGIVITVTNNSFGGQPVSMASVEAVRVICDRENILLILDGCRIAENSYFIKHRESGYEEWSYREIAQKMLRLADAFILSAKKDGLVNIGGLLCMKDYALSLKCTNQLILSEGFSTYGGLAGRDMQAMAIGLREVFEPDYLEYRIKSTAYLGERLRNMGIPVLWPIGGHAVYVDAGQLFPHILPHEFPGQALVCELYVRGGIRSVDVGSVMFGKFDSEGNFTPARKELVRLAIPRRVYTQSHIDYVLDIFKEIKEMDQILSGFKILYEPPFLRHFTVRFEKINPKIIEGNDGAGT